MKVIVVVALCLFSLTVNAQQVHASWEQNLKNELHEFMACDKEVANGIDPCSLFIGKALQSVYKINDFYAPELGRYMLTTEVARYLQESSKWTLLGHGYEAEALAEAQEHANNSKATVAV